MGKKHGCYHCRQSVGAATHTYYLTVITEDGSSYEAACCSMLCAEQARQKHVNLHLRRAHIVGNQQIRGVKNERKVKVKTNEKKERAVP